MHKLLISSTIIFDYSNSDSIVLANSRPNYCRDTPCAKGSSCTYENASLWCTPCLHPQISTDGLTCTQCPSAQGPSPGRSHCVPCEPGLASVAGECFACPLGEEPNDAQRDCNQCDDIHVSEGGHRCVLCGNFSQPNQRRDACTPCNPVQESFDAAERKCVCAPGQTRVGDHCQSCPPQQFKPHPGDESCSACGTSTQSNRDHTACMCPVNTYNITYGMIMCFDTAEQITADLLEVDINTAGMAPCQTCDDLPCVDCGMIFGSDDVASHVTVRDGYGLPLSLLDSGYTGLQSGAPNTVKHPRIPIRCATFFVL